MSKLISFVSAFISPPKKPKAISQAQAQTQAPPPPPPPTFLDSAGKKYANKLDRDAAQKQLDRKAKFPAQTADTAALNQFRIGMGAGKPKVTNPVVATASTGSGITIAGA